METFAERLRTSLDNAGISPAELSRRAFVSRATVSQWLSGQIQNINVANLERVSKALSVDPGWLIGRTRKPVAAVNVQESGNSIDDLYQLLLDDQKEEIRAQAENMVAENKRMMAELIKKYGQKP